MLVCVDDVEKVVQGLVGDLDYSNPEKLVESSRSSKTKIVGSKPLAHGTRAATEGSGAGASPTSITAAAAAVGVEDYPRRTPNGQANFEPMT